MWFRIFMDLTEGIAPMMKPLEQWICDYCGNLIESIAVQHGMYVFWSVILH